MSWFCLIIASIFEVGWPLGFKLSTLHPDKSGLYIGLSAVSMLLSGLFLYLAQRDIPIATAYIVWTGIGAVVTFIIGIVVFRDPVTVWRMLFALMIIVGIVGMEVTGKR